MREWFGFRHSVLVASALTLALGGCTAAREAMPARLEISTTNCVASPDLNGATSFAAPKDKDGVFTATIRFADNAACLVDGSGQKSAYAVLVLPANEQQMIVTVTSYAMGHTIFSPRLEIRDEASAVLRTVGREVFMFNGSSLQTQLRQRPGDRYLVIASDGASAGKSVEQIQSTRVTSGAMIGTAYVPINSGGESKAQLIFAHNGEVSVTVGPLPKMDGK